MPRPRKAKNQGLPPNLYVKRQGKNTYFEYRRTDTKTWHGLGKDRVAAIEAAKILNTQITPPPKTAQELANEVLGAQETVQTYAEHFLDDNLKRRTNAKGKQLSPKTLKDYAWMLQNITEHLGPSPLHTVTRRTITKFLNKYPSVMRNRYRSLLHQMFKHAVAEGFIDNNPVAGTLRSTENVRRKRLTLTQFKKIRNHKTTPDWMRLAMDLALTTLLRRSDIVRFSQKNLTDGYLKMRAQKTQTPLKIKLPRQLYENCQSGLGKKLEDQHLKPEKLSREFKRLREICEIDQDNPPTFHEIRALGAKLYKEKGLDPQVLLGHASPEMTRKYLDRHEETWTEIDFT